MSRGAAVAACSCGRSYDRLAFLDLALPVSGRDVTDSGIPGYVLVLRNCSCGSTIAAGTHEVDRGPRYQLLTSEEWAAIETHYDGIANPPPPVRLFVYGTLQRGERLNPSLAAGGTFLAEAQTDPCWSLVSLGSFPALVPGGRTSVVGELWRVDAEAIATLDRIEAGYDRRTVRICGVAHGRPFHETADAYVLREAPGRAEVITSGDWKAHRRAVEGKGRRGR